MKILVIVALLGMTSCSDAPQHWSVATMGDGGSSGDSVLGGSSGTFGGVSNGGNSAGASGGGSASGSNGASGASSSSAAFHSLSAGYDFSCIVTSGSVKCWGGNANNQLGSGFSFAPEPVVVPGLTAGIAAVDVDNNAIESTSCALTEQGGVECLSDAKGPVPIVGLTSGVEAMARNASDGCAIVNGGGVACWGSNYRGQLGNNSTVSSPGAAVPVTGLTAGVRGISVGGSEACAITAQGGLVCWGFNGTGLLGNGTLVNSPVPVPVTGLESGVTAVSIGAYSACAIAGGGALYCWGDNNQGELGNGSTATCEIGKGSLCSLVPVPVPALASGVRAVSVSKHYGDACAITSTGAVECWGENRAGQLGDGTIRDSAVPVGVVGLTSGVTEVSVGGLHACAVIASNSVECWGMNEDNQLGSAPDPTCPSTLVSKCSTLPLLIAGF